MLALKPGSTVTFTLELLASVVNILSYGAVLDGAIGLRVGIRSDGGRAVGTETVQM